MHDGERWAGIGKIWTWPVFYFQWRGDVGAAQIAGVDRISFLERIYGFFDATRPIFRWVLILVFGALLLGL
jgi:hypothetical protein